MKKCKRKMRGAARTHLIAFLIILIAGASCFSLYVPTVSAAATVNADSISCDNEMMDSSYVGVSSEPKSAIRLRYNVSSGPITMGTTTVVFSGSGFSTTTLAALGTGTSSGVILYQDNGTDTGAFDDNDSIVPMALAPTWTGTSTIVFIDYQSPPSLSNGDNYFFVVIRTSGSATHGTQITLTIPTNGAETLDGSGPGSNYTTPNPFLIDAQAPVVSAVEKMNDNKAELVFSEMINFMSGPPATSDFSLSDGLTVMDVYMEGPGVLRIVADGDITVGSTTLTVLSSFTDFAGNYLSGTGTPQTITAPRRVKISEVSAEMSSASSEFIELYNGTASDINMNGWLLQASADGSSWTTLNTISGTIEGYKFRLYSTTELDAESATDGDANFTSGSLPLAGGHVRLTDGTTTIDKLGWGTAASPEGTAIAAHSAGQSLERKTFGMSNASDMAPGGNG